MKCIKCKDNIASTDGFCWKCSGIKFVIDKPNNMQSKEFEERIYIKDNVDGQEHCLSGDKQFYLIDVTQEYKQHFLPKSVVREKIENIKELVGSYTPDLCENSVDFKNHVIDSLKDLDL